MALTFVDTHNMIAHLTKLDVSEGFEQILDFLNTNVIQYALMVNPTIYVSCIKQFSSFILIEKVNDDVRLQALIDRRKIFVELARMGLVRNVDSSSKFYMYPRFLQLMIAAQVGGRIKTGGIIELIDADEDATLEEVAAEVDATKDAKVAKVADI
nr:hypothetical protein [Tanacetum cinerariifolium]